jgi:hypothetical protein
VLHDARYCSAPTSVEGSDRVLLHVCYQYRNAVRGTDSEHQAGEVRHQTIAFEDGLAIRCLKLAREGAVFLPDRLGYTGVNLADGYQLEIIVSSRFASYGPKKATSILGYTGRVILFCPAEIEGISTINSRNTSGPGAKTMPQPPELLPFLNADNIKPRNLLIHNMFHL